MTHPWERVGERVRVAPVTEADLPALRAAIAGSLHRLAPWGPTGLDRLDTLPADPAKTTLLVHALDPGDGHGIASRIALSNRVGGRLRSATLGYDAYDPYAGRGLTREGLRLAVEIAFAPEPDGMGLHRLEADVQPVNVRSAGLLRSVGFRHEGFAPRLVHLPGPGDPHDAWRDHDRYTLLQEDWPSAAYPPEVSRRIACVVNGLPGSGKSTLGTRLAAELHVPYLGKDLIKEVFADALPQPGMLADPFWQNATGAAAGRAVWKLLAASPVGGVVEIWAPPARDRDHVRAGLVRAGFEPARVPEVFCEVPVHVARDRDRARVAAGSRHAIHRTLTDEVWAEAARAAGPLGLGPVLLVDTSRPVTDAEVCRLALAARAASA